MTEPILINSGQETEYNIRPVTNLYEFEYGLFSEKFNIYFNDKTDTNNPFLASVEIQNSLGQKRWINYKPYTTETVTLQYVDKNKVLYKGVFAPNIDVEYEILNGQLKENIILNSPTPLREFEFTLKLSEFINYELNKDGDIIFTDSLTDEELWKIPAPNMIDARGMESTNLYYSFEEINGYLSIIINLHDEDFLNSAIYPIKIDPTTLLVFDYSDGISFGTNPIARDSNGYVYIVFGKYISNYFRVFIRRITPTNIVEYWNGVSFSTSGTETKIDNAYGSDTAEKPSIAIDSNNYVHLIYVGESSYPQVRYIYFYNNGTNWVWSGVTELTSFTNRQQSSPSIAIDSNNNIHIIWSGRDDTNTTNEQIKYARKVSGVWTNWENIYTISGYSQYNPFIGIDSNNNIHVVWEGTESGVTSQIRYATLNYTGSSTWGSWIYKNKIQTITGRVQASPKLAIDLNNNLHVVWNGKDNTYTTNDQIKYSRKLNGSDTWSNWININITSGYNQLSPSISIDNTNNLHIVWRGTDSSHTTNYQIKYSKSIYNGSDWGTWSGFSYITNSANSYTINPALCWSKFNFYNKLDLAYVNSTNYDIYYQDITPVPPNTPSLLTATVQSSSRILWSWTDNSSDEVNFKLRDSSGNLITANLYLSDGTTPISNGLIPANTTSIIERGLSANSPYTRRIVAINENGESPYDEESTTTRVLPNVISFTGTKNGLNNITWTINKT